ncbi:DUF3570 domain-containing protein [Tenacibaculum sp.]|nr:DUF3570 domain-containing protein [Tenacibaculum sp.]
MSYYKQDGNNASVTGGIGTEKLDDITPTIVVKIPLNSDSFLTADFGISAYSSASSSNLDPFDASGASGNYDEDEDDNENKNKGNNAAPTEGSPWVASSGASKSDTWMNGTISYSHSSDDRNIVWGVNTSVSSEYDYSSIGFGANISKSFNQKNTEVGISGKVFFDNWDPKYPTELDSYIEAGNSLNNGFFSNVDILNQQGNIIDKNGINRWSPYSSELVTTTNRNTFNVSLSFSQILSKNAQFSLSVDFVKQQGWLANPMQRVYFSDKNNYYIGNASNIPNYTRTTNTNVFHLADDIERLPSSRLKIPIGGRFNYYVNENIVIKSYYRYYYDNWGIKSHTADVEIPIKFKSGMFTLYPNYRYYTQTAATYFAPYNEHLSTSEFYTSDYDLSKFNSHQYGMGFRYTDVLGKFKVSTFSLKSFDLRYNSYDRSNGLKSNIVSFGVKFVLD